MEETKTAVRYFKGSVLVAVALCFMSLKFVAKIGDWEKQDPLGVTILILLCATLTLIFGLGILLLPHVRT